MGEITKYQSVSIATIMSRLETMKHNPSTIQKTVLELLDEITEGEVDIVDPSSPFVFLLESSAVNTAMAVNETMAALRSQYPSLAQTEEDLYKHMSDKDYLDRFAVPSNTNFTIVLQMNDVLGKMAVDTQEDCTKAIIPRDTEFLVENTVFTLQYPIVVRKFNNGVVQISYDATIVSPLSTLSTNMIDYTVRQDSAGVSWIFFKVNVSQFKIDTTIFPLQKSIPFQQDIIYVDQFYYARAYYRNNANGNVWTEMITTHTEQVFDPFKPTAIVKVFDGYVNVYIPVVYLLSNAISGEVRFDIYTTKGLISVNLSNYKLTSFTLALKAIDKERDINDFTNAMTNISYYTYSEEIINSGRSAISFETLRQRALDNTIGLNNDPITNVRLEAYANDKGFELIKNTDVLTNRIFLAIQKLPKPSNAKLTTSANIGVSTYLANITYLKTLDTVANNTDRVTLLPSNLYVNINGIVRILTAEEIDTIKAMSKIAMVNHINSKQYIYSPFYYVLDSSGEEFELRAYNLDNPKASNLSFISQNQTMQLPVNTGSYELVKFAGGYKLIIVTKSGNFYKQLSDGQCAAQLAYYPEGESDLAYITGKLISSTPDEERVYEFTLLTNHDVDNKNRLCITNAKMFGNETMNTWLNLSHEFHILYASTSITVNYVADTADSILGKFDLVTGMRAITHETIVFKIGTALKNLWTRTRSIPTGLDYKLHAEDVPLLYEEDVYAKDPVTGAIFTVNAAGELIYNIEHHRGEQVYDSLGSPVYKFLKGSVVLDEAGNPVIDSELATDKEIDLLFVDGKHYFVNDSSFLSYNKELVGVIDSWITNDIQTIQDKLIEQTRIYFYPKTTLGKVKVLVDDVSVDFLSSEQSLVVDLYVKPAVYNDITVRQQLESATVKLLDTYISGITVNTTEITNALGALYGNNVETINLTGIGGAKNYRIIYLATEHNRLCLKKALEIQQDGTLIIKEDVKINFHKLI